MNWRDMLVRTSAASLWLVMACGCSPRQHAQGDTEIDGGTALGDVLAPGDEEIRCKLAWGYLLEPAPRGSMVVPMSSIEHPERWEPRVSPGSLGLVVSIDHAEAEALDGRTVACRESGGHPTYLCEDAAGLRSVTIAHGEQRWTRDVRDCIEEDPVAFKPSDIARCVEPQTTVIEGSLLGLNANGGTSVEVALLGEGHLEYQADRLSSPLLPTRPCSVSGNHYVCSTLGYRETVAHRLRIRIGEQRAVTASILLPIQECQVALVRKDVQAVSNAAHALGALVEPVLEGSP